MKIDEKALSNVCKWAEHRGLDWSIAREVVMAYEAAKAPATGQQAWQPADPEISAQAYWNHKRIKEQPDEIRPWSFTVDEEVYRCESPWLTGAQIKSMLHDQHLIIHPSNEAIRDDDIILINTEPVQRFFLIPSAEGGNPWTGFIAAPSYRNEGTYFGAGGVMYAPSPKRESVDRWQTMDTAPKDRAILLLIETCWLPLPWVGCWSYGREDWNVYLPFKTGDKNTTTYGFTPMGWMDIPKANEIEGQKPHG